MELSERILFVDDDEPIRRAFQRTLKTRGLEVDLAEDAWAAMKLAKRDTYSVIAIDYNMPGLNGLELREELRLLQPHATYLLISGNCDLALTLHAVNEHSMSYIIPKPWNADELGTIINRAMEESWERVCSHEVIACLARNQGELENLRAARNLTPAHVALSAASALLGVLEARDTATHAHSQRIQGCARLLGLELGLDSRQLTELELAAQLHDIGKAVIPDSILNKPGSLTEFEWKIVRKHPEVGVRLLQDIEGAEGISAMVVQHHERWDGDGYPHGLSGAEISLGARILAVADTVDTILSDRPFHEAASYKLAGHEIARGYGSQFDPAVVMAFLAISQERMMGARDAGSLAA